MHLPSPTQGPVAEPCACRFYISRSRPRPRVRAWALPHGSGGPLHSSMERMTDSEALPAPMPKERPIANLGVLIGGTAAGAGVVTLLVSILPWVDFAYRSRPLHVAIETAASIIGLLAAYLLLGRYRRSASLRDLLLVGAFLLLAATNLCFSSLPAMSGGPPGRFETWSPVAGSLLGALRSHRPRARPGSGPPGHARRLRRPAGRDCRGRRPTRPQAPGGHGPRRFRRGLWAPLDRRQRRPVGGAGGGRAALRRRGRGLLPPSRSNRR